MRRCKHGVCGFSFHSNKQLMAQFTQLKPERKDYEISYHSGLLAWKDADHGIMLTIFPHDKQADGVSSWAVCCDDPSLTMTERESSRHSPLFHLSFPGYTADKTSSNTGMWPDCLDGGVSPTGVLTKQFRRPGMCTLCHSLRTQYLSYVIQQGFETDRHMYVCTKRFWLVDLIAISWHSARFKRGDGQTLPVFFFFCYAYEGTRTGFNLTSQYTAQGP